MKKIIYHSGYFIGRTDDYYCDDDESVFTPDYWTYSSNKESDDFADEGPVFELTQEGRKLLDQWLEEQNYNEWQRLNSGYYKKNHLSREQLWLELTDMDNGYVINPDQDNSDDIHVDVYSGYGTNAYFFYDITINNDFANACSCRYYGSGRSEWTHHTTDNELADWIWEFSLYAMGDGVDKCKYLY